MDACDEDDNSASPTALALIPSARADNCTSPYPSMNGKVYSFILLFFILCVLTRHVEPPIDVVRTPPRDDITQPATPAPLFERVHVSSPYYTASNVSVDTVDPFESLVRRRMSGSALYTAGPVKPLGDPITARLVQHYIDNLASWVCILTNNELADGA